MGGRATHPAPLALLALLNRTNAVAASILRPALDLVEYLTGLWTQPLPASDSDALAASAMPIQIPSGLTGSIRHSKNW